MSDFEAFYGRRCRSPVGWFEVVEISILCHEIVYEAVEVVRMVSDRSKIAYTRQKSYTVNRRRDLEFDICYWVY